MNGTDRQLIRAIRGPVTLITVGVLFALNNFTPYGFSQTWPVLLIVFGALSLLRRSAGGPPPPPRGPAFSPYTYPPGGAWNPSAYPPPPHAGGDRETTPPPGGAV
ncbi:MAG TPA: DUF5668 domain-containing protein [Bryobacteraceae bacterium]|nr:DUF5668 domain-containing protein [Bryobacteraceae bacterium]